MRAPAKPKPSAAEETARVVRIYRWLAEEIDTTGSLLPEERQALIAVAERIAARTED